jgi:serine/threonine-protein kinase
MKCIRCKAEIEKTYKACPHCGEAVTDFVRRYSDELLDGKYRLLERLGVGGMGEVFKALHTYLDAVRVIKIVRPQIAENSDAIDRFLREARLATKVQHPNVATLHDFSALPDGSHYMVWEFIDGENLTQILRHRGTLQPAEAIEITVQALAGLDAIHRAGIVHRDISPENLMIERNGGRVKIIDLGVAKSDDPDQAATRTGLFLGKLRYASPEHLGVLREEEKLDGRADLYSLGVVLYEMLTGRPPFEATSPHQYLLHHSRDDVPRQLDLTRVPAELRNALSRVLERDRDKRFPNARAFADALSEITTAKTMTKPLDLDATMRVGGDQRSTLERSTIRSDFGKPAPRTVIDSSPIVSASERPPQGNTRAAIIIGVAIIIATIIGVWAMRSTPPEEKPIISAPDSTTPPRVAETRPAPPPASESTQQSQTSVDVTPAPTTATSTTTTTSALKPQPPVKSATVESPPRRVEPVTTTHEPPPQPAPAPAPAVHPYVEGGDSDTNNAALERARTQLSGVTHVAVTGDGDPAMQALLEQILRRNGMTVANGADVVINFNGTREMLGRGRKRRAAKAVVTKNGRVVLRYEMAPEEYRIGDNAAEAFARVLNEALGR